MNHNLESLNPLRGTVSIWEQIIFKLPSSGPHRKILKLWILYKTLVCGDSKNCK